jgi:hypothetical protein
MRILGYVEHPQLKITVFKMDNRISVKFENEGYEQTFKLGADDRVADLEKVKTWIDAPLLESVQNVFQNMHQNRLAAFSRNFSNANQLFEEII